GADAAAARSGKRHEAIGAAGAADHADLVSLRDAPCDLQAAAILRRPEIRQRVAGGRLAAQIGRNRPGLIRDVRPVLGPDRPAVARIAPARDVAEGEHVLHALDGHALVAENAVAEPDTAAFQPVGARHRADADHDEAGFDDAAVRKAQTFDPAGP